MKKIDLFKEAEVLTSEQIANTIGGDWSYDFDRGNSNRHDIGDSTSRDNGDSYHSDYGDSRALDNRTEPYNLPMII